MDGTTLLRELRQALQEGSDSSWLDTKTSYSYLYQAACNTAKRARIPRTTQTITTVADTSTYYLNGDFLDLYLMDDDNKEFIKYYDTSNYHFINMVSYDSIILANQTTSVLIPSAFTIIPAAQLTVYTGAVTSDGATSAGECTLTATAATFTNVFAGDFVHNTTDGSNGVVVYKTSDTALITALFDGTNDDWTSTDVYRVHPQARFQIVFDPPPSTKDHTITVYYVQKPTPVYSSFRRYNFPDEWTTILAQYAAWLYKYRDREPGFGDAFYKNWDYTLRRYAGVLNAGLERRGLRLNLMKRS